MRRDTDDSPDLVDSSIAGNIMATEDSRGVFSGGTGEASQETISRHFQKVMGLSPITKLDSEAVSSFAVGLNKLHTE